VIHIEKVHIVWVDVGTFENPDERVYGGLIVDYRQNDMEGHVKLDYPENVAMNLTLRDIRQNVVLTLREAQ
jgi:hypothetical protein